MDVTFSNTRFLFYKKVFLPSTYTFLTLSWSQYQNFLKIFLAKILQFWCIAHVH